MLLPAHTQDALPQPSLSNQSFVLVPCKLVGTGAHGHQYLHHSQLETSVDVFLSLQYLPSWLVISQAAKTPLMFPQGFAALAWAPVSVFFFFLCLTPLFSRDQGDFLQCCSGRGPVTPNWSFHLWVSDSFSRRRGGGPAWAPYVAEGRPLETSRTGIR